MTCSTPLFCAVDSNRSIHSKEWFSLQRRKNVSRSGDLGTPTKLFSAFQRNENRALHHSVLMEGFSPIQGRRFLLFRMSVVEGDELKVVESKVSRGANSSRQSDKF